MKATGSRRGKHRRGKIRIQFVTDRKTKAILVYTAAFVNKTLTDLLIDGGMDVAMAKGIVDANLKVKPEHVDGVNVSEEFLMSQEGDK